MLHEILSRLKKKSRVDGSIGAAAKESEKGASQSCGLGVGDTGGGWLARERVIQQNSEDSIECARRRARDAIEAGQTGEETRAAAKNELLNASKSMLDELKNKDALEIARLYIKSGGSQRYVSVRNMCVCAYQEFLDWEKR